MKLTDDVKQRKQKHFKQYRTAKQKLPNKENLVRFLHRGKPVFQASSKILEIFFSIHLYVTSLLMDLLLEPVTGNEKEHFCVEMMKRLDIQRRNEHFCDVILEVGSGDDQARLKAHRLVLCAGSPFFYSALNSDMKEKKEGVIRLVKTSKTVMEEVLEFLYTGHVDVTQHNAFDLLEMADFLVMPSLKEVSSKFISRILCSSNCLMAYYSAVRYQCPELQKQAREFTFVNFVSVTESDDFLNLNIEQVEEWISSDEIKVEGEEEVFQVIVKWMERNDCKELERFFELFRFVRVVYLSRNFVFNVILRHPFVRNSEVCTSFVLDAMREASNGTEECYFVQPPRSCLNMHEDALIACGDKKTFCYVASQNKWYEMVDMLSERNFPVTLSASHGKLYLSGGDGSGERSTMDRYDPSVNSWAPLQSYNSTIACNTAAVVNFQGSLFVIGGSKNENEASDSVHRFNPSSNLWQEVAPLSVARYGVCAVADSNTLYAIGGVAGNECLDVAERFDPDSNSWGRVASTIEKKVFSCAAVVRGNVFLFGGFTKERPSASSSLVEMYEPTSNTWTGIQCLTAPEITLDVECFKGEVFVLGISRQESSRKLSLQIYNAVKNEWRPCPIVSTSSRDGSSLLKLVSLRIPRDVLNLCKVLSET